jgi:hypothetical protein
MKHFPQHLAHPRLADQPEYLVSERQRLAFASLRRPARARVQLFSRFAKAAKSAEIRPLLSAAIVVTAVIVTGGWASAGSLTLVTNLNPDRATNLLVNGSFEGHPTGATSDYYWATGTTDSPQGTPAGWTGNGGASNYAVWGNTALNDVGSAAIPDGLAALYFGNWIVSAISETPAFNPDGLVVFSSPAVITADAGGFTPAVTLSQTLTGLIPGQSYGLSFWASGEDAATTMFGHDGIFALDVTECPTVYLAAPSGRSNLGASHNYQFLFVPSTPVATITFTNWGHIIGPAGWNLPPTTELVLDDVVLNHLCTPAQCAPGYYHSTISYSAGYGPQTLPWTTASMIPVPKFTSNLGQLISATIQVDVDFAVGVHAQNLDPNGGCTLSWSATSLFTTTLPPTSTNIVLHPSLGGGIALAPGGAGFEGVRTIASQTGVLTCAADLAALAGTGDLAFSLNAIDAFTSSGCAHVQVDPLDTSATSLSITVTYTYCAVPIVTACDSNSFALIACPCSNPPSGPARGCDNSSLTGGASMSGIGMPSLGADTLVFTTAGEKPTATSIVLQGTSFLPSGVVFGQGVRCVAGTLKRLYVKTASGGSITAPSGADPTVSARSVALGDAISAGEQRYYMVYYRDPGVLNGCPSTSTFNATQALSVAWLP